MHCLNLKLQGPKLQKGRSYRTKRSINYNDALRPYTVWGALCSYISGNFEFLTEESICRELEGFE